MLKKIKKINWNKLKIEQTPRNMARMGIVAAIVVAVGAAAMLALAPARTGMTIEQSLSGVTGDAVTGAELRIAVIRMDEIQANATVLADLRRQKESFESRLRDDMNREQRALERERDEIERAQGMLSQDALQRRVMEFQQRVATLQRTTMERAQSIEVNFQQALVEIQRRDLDPIIEGIIARKNLALVIDGRFARVGAAAPAGLDITDDVIGALNRRTTSFRMSRPAGF